MHRCWRREDRRVSNDSKNHAECRLPLMIKMVWQSLKDLNCLNDREESLLIEELPQIRIVRQREVQISELQQECQTIIPTNTCMMKSHPKLTKDGTA
jgi:hypothetical protein